MFRSSCKNKKELTLLEDQPNECRLLVLSPREARGGQQAGGKFCLLFGLRYDKGGSGSKAHVPGLPGSLGVVDAGCTMPLAWARRLSR